MRTLEQIKKEYEEAVAALKAKSDEFDAAAGTEEVEGEEQTRAWSPEQEAEIKPLIEKAEALKKEMDEFEEPSVTDEERQQRAARVQALLSAQTRDSGNGGAPQQIRSTGLNEEQGFYDDFLHWALTGRLSDGGYSDSYEMVLPSLIRDEGERELDMQARAGGAMQQRAISSSGASEAIPGQSVQRIIETLYEADIIRAAGATVITTDDGNQVSLPLLRRPATPAARLIEPESDEATAYEPTVAGPNLNAHVYRGRADIPDELSADERAGLVASLPGFLAEALLAIRGLDHLNGDGSDNANGLIGYISDNNTDRIAIANLAAITMANVDSMLNLIGTPYQGRARVMAHPSIATRIERLNTSGVPAYPGGELLGNRILRNSAMPSAVTTGSINLIAFVPNMYYIRDARGVRVTRDPYSRAVYNEIRLHFQSRGDGAYVKTNDTNGTTNIAALRGS